MNTKLFENCTKAALADRTSGIKPENQAQLIEALMQHAHAHEHDVYAGKGHGR